MPKKMTKPKNAFKYIGRHKVNLCDAYRFNTKKITTLIMGKTEMQIYPFEKSQFAIRIWHRSKKKNEYIHFGYKF